MFTDELERHILEQHSHAESLQAWAQQVREAAHEGKPLRTRMLLPVGERLIKLGTKLTQRFGIPA